MNILVWVLVAGITGWLTGKLVGEEGYGKILRGRCVIGLDILFGIVGAFVGGCLFFWVSLGEISLFSILATAVLGSITLAAAARLISARYFPSLSFKGMSREAYIELQDDVAAKEFARWHSKS